MNIPQKRISNEEIVTYLKYDTSKFNISRMIIHIMHTNSYDLQAFNSKMSLYFINK